MKQARDVVRILRRECEALKRAGVDFIQLDEPSVSQVVYGDEAEQTFMCAALGTRRDPSEELDFAVRLMNETVAGIDGVRFGVHICRGNWSRKEDVLLKGNYGPLLPSLMRMNIHQLVLEMATPRAGEIEVFKEFKNSDVRVKFLGVLTLVLLLCGMAMIGLSPLYLRKD